MKQSLGVRIRWGLVFVAFIVVGFTASNRIEFYYYFPDSSQINIAGLKQRMEAFFIEKNVVIGFQPFLRFSDFMFKIKENMPEFILIPEWHFKSYADELKLKPILIPKREGHTFYKKVLIVKKDSGIGLKEIKNETLALTNMGPMNDQILNDILFYNMNTDAGNIKIIKVPKDTDAIFALALGQVDMAFVVRDNLKKIESLYPEIVKDLVFLVESKPLSMPILCSAGDQVSKEHIETMKKLFLEKDASKELSDIKSMLQIDTWVSYESN